MRARHRHFNPRGIGAKLVFDARYINQSDNTAVSTWPDRSGNGWDATQSTPANQPTFQTAEFGGSGVVRFDGNNDILYANGSVGLLRNVGGATLVAVNKSTVSSGNGPKIFFSTNSVATRARIAQDGGAGYEMGGRRLDTDSFQTIANNTFSTTRTLIQTGVFDYSNSDAFLFLDGTQSASSTSFQTSGNTSNSDSAYVSLGNNNIPQAFNGDIGQVLAFDVALNASQRKRTEHAAAYSFKISCN